MSDMKLRLRALHLLNQMATSEARIAALEAENAALRKIEPGYSWYELWKIENEQLQAKTWECERLKRCGNCFCWVFDMLDHETKRCMAWPVNGQWLTVSSGDSCHHSPSLWEHVYAAAHQPEEGKP